jgi:hypothetical protein
MAVSPARQRYLPRCRTGRGHGAGALVRCVAVREPRRGTAQLRGPGPWGQRIAAELFRTGTDPISPPGWGETGARPPWLGAPLRRLRAAARRLGRGVGDRLFRASDTEAFLWGWQTTRTSLGLGRRYRDQRFGRLAMRGE